jgi:outer membrane immunogenic protein
MAFTGQMNAPEQRGRLDVNKKYIAIAAAVGTLLPAGPAFAEDFDGPFVGVQAGYEQAEVQEPGTELGVLTYDDEVQTFTGGLFAGYDKQIAPRVVLGVEGGFDLSRDDTMDGLIGGSLASIDPEWSLDLTARAGFMPDSTSLLYVRGGYEHAQVETTALGATGAQFTNSENRDGWTIGTGYERQLMQNVHGRLEYRYSDLSEGDGNWDRHRILAGVSYRF